MESYKNGLWIIGEAVKVTDAVFEPLELFALFQTFTVAGGFRIEVFVGGGSLLAISLGNRWLGLGDKVSLMWTSEMATFGHSRINLS